MENVPAYISVAFGLTTILTVGLFYKATKKSATSLKILLIWLAIQSAIALTGFYTVTDTIPPRILLLGLPALLVIISLFTTSTGKKFIDSLDIKTLMIMNTIRIPVELVLLGLYIHKAVPELMTFEGRNFDIFSGMTAPFVYYFGLIKKQMSNKIILLWNFICLGLLLNIVINAILSVPTPFQQFAFDQPNIAILYFPFVWLPCCVVPLVLLAHLTTIRQLLHKGIESQ